MLEYDRIDISEGIDTNKTIASKGCNICHQWLDLMQKAISFNDVVIFSIKGNDYRI